MIEVFTNSGGTGSPAYSDVVTGTSKTFTGVTAGTYYVRVTPNDNVNPDPSCSLQMVVVSAASGIADLTDKWGYWKSDAGTTGTNTMTAWADQSGNGRNLTAVSGNEPALINNVINGLAVVSSYGKSAQMATSANFPNLSAGGTIYFVGRQKAAGAVFSGDAGGAWLGAGSAVNAQVRRGDVVGSGYGSIIGGINTNDANSPETTDHVNEDQFYTVRLRYDGTNNYLAINNGTEVQLASSGGGYIATPFTIFSTLSATPGNKQFAAILICTTNHNLATRNSVENELKTKYNHY